MVTAATRIVFAGHISRVPRRPDRRDRNRYNTAFGERDQVSGLLGLA